MPRCSAFPRCSGARRLRVRAPAAAEPSRQEPLAVCLAARPSRVVLAAWRLRAGAPVAAEPSRQEPLAACRAARPSWPVRRVRRPGGTGAGGAIAAGASCGLPRLSAFLAGSSGAATGDTGGGGAFAAGASAGLPRCSAFLAGSAGAAAGVAGARHGRRHGGLRGLATLLGSSSPFGRCGDRCCRFRRRDDLNLGRSHRCSRLQRFQLCRVERLPGIVGKLPFLDREGNGRCRRCALRHDPSLRRRGGRLVAGGAAAPMTLACTGATAATDVTGALTSISLDIRTAAFPTGCDCTNAVAGTATTAPGTC